MKITMLPGKYVLAVSGGVDSMVLLDLLRLHPGVELVVAHFEHGIRLDSDQDRQLVEASAKKHNLPFVFDRGNLGVNASENEARIARYKFLNQVLADHGAQAIITAHHQDDIIETALLNVIRGTGRKGLSSLGSHAKIIRPLLHVSKKEILDYAHKHAIKWHEDSTNSEEKYLRNYVRLKIIPFLGVAGRRRMLAHLSRAKELNTLIDQSLGNDASSERTLDRYWFIMLPYDVSCEVMASWLRKHQIREFDRHTIERLTVAAKTATAGKNIDILARKHIHVDKKTLTLVG